MTIHSRQSLMSCIASNRKSRCVAARRVRIMWWSLAPAVVCALASVAKAAEHHADVVVIGAGPVGLTAALAARQSGAKTVVVLDKRSTFPFSRLNTVNIV